MLCWVVVWLCTRCTTTHIDTSSDLHSQPLSWLSSLTLLLTPQHCHQTMMYWFPKRALTGKRQVSSVYSLLRGYTVMKTWLDGTSAGSGAVVGSAGGDECVGSLGLVNLTFWCCWTRCPKIVSLVSGQYFAMLEYVRPLKVSQFPALMVSNHICLTWKPKQAW